MASRSDLRLAVLLLHLIVLRTALTLNCHCQRSNGAILEPDCFFNQLRTCAPGAFCYTMHLRSDDGAVEVESGCSSQPSLCDQFSDTAAFQCCNTDRCNQAFHDGGFPTLSAEGTSQGPTEDTSTDLASAPPHPAESSTSSPATAPGPTEDSSTDHASASHPAESSTATAPGSTQVNQATTASSLTPISSHHQPSSPTRPPHTPAPNPSSPRPPPPPPSPPSSSDGLNPEPETFASWWIIAVAISIAVLLVVLIAMTITIIAVQVKWSKSDTGSESSSEVGLKSPKLKVTSQPVFLVQAGPAKGSVQTPTVDNLVCWGNSTPV